MYETHMRKIKTFGRTEKDLNNCIHSLYFGMEIVTILKMYFFKFHNYCNRIF